MESAPVIDIKNLEIGFDLSAKTDRFYPPVNLSASKGELIALVGRNGIGKSTFLRTIARLQSSISGDIYIKGIPFSNIKREDFSKELSFIPAEPIHAANMTVQEFVTIARYPYHGWFGSLSSIDREVIHSALESVNLLGFSQREVDSLSDGERQRAMIAFAIAQDSQIVLMDEPTAFIDLPNKFEIVRLLKLLTSKGKTVIFSTHDLHTALREVDTLWLMLSDGFAIGSPEDLALNGSLNRLMEGTDVYLDLSTGGFVSKKIGGNRIMLASSNSIRYQWTKHALERLGYTIEMVDDRDLPSVECVIRDDTWVWRYCKKEYTQEFDSILKLSSFLKNS